MYVVHSTIQVPMEWIDDVIALYRQRSRLVDHWPGFVSFALLQNEHRTGELTIQLVWQSKAHYLAWVQSDDFRRVHEREEALVAQGFPHPRPLVRKYEVVAT
ncbi:antibiotic biosynthesis monooxygenase family protein [Alicyclobacillus acidocaldarius]|uniref:Antibiotic biosynthesis monooxygenase n=1 Tax=Alicyclobacillus acidocaldarius subsp. acidocaldarius (strain ATCC 27009 / DSM 446 / BCRC 14685 / JCM 5260 / KCTC 1825 / NBRC 15652 / NCIMB 11725 / NRRL B-14509 / 104-IA) TaxID=521098 RepID=C8WTH7_ALIAD|nr:antibiotic biosynthesis monooxygenase [Alicyclobacillus acidocaldarius]ACV57719.1 Antibiotic biosynthesis monooxygenase [Alicyclobacillus acidocaldarius subsp. acidocaldarius DSM 446]